MKTFSIRRWNLWLRKHSSISSKSQRTELRSIFINLHSRCALLVELSQVKSSRKSSSSDNDCFIKWNDMNFHLKQCSSQHTAKPHCRANHVELKMKLFCVLLGVAHPHIKRASPPSGRAQKEAKFPPNKREGKKKRKLIIIRIRIPVDDLPLNPKEFRWRWSTRFSLLHSTPMPSVKKRGN